MYIGTTRFNNITWQELQHYKEKEKISGAIYGFPIRLKETISLKKNLFIIEMNNDENEIMGVGIIVNWLDLRKPRRIYKDRNYNRYIYKGTPYMSRYDMIKYGDQERVDFIDNLLFKGSGHLKRGQSVTEITKVKKYQFYQRFQENMVDYLLTIFQNKYVNK